MAQSVRHPTLAQVMISQFVGSSPASGSVLRAQGLEPASDSVSPSLSLYPSPPCALSLSKINIKIFVLFKKTPKLQLLKCESLGLLGGLICWASDFGSGCDLVVLEFEPCVRLCAYKIKKKIHWLLPLTFPLHKNISPVFTFPSLNSLPSECKLKQYLPASMFLTFSLLIYT